ncbi:MAG: hypothetical protein WCH59_01155 [Chitinophagia bacterium]|jgi:hypothetical protein
MLKTQESSILNSFPFIKDSLKFLKITLVSNFLKLIFVLVFTPFLLIATLIIRLFVKKKIDVGLGPDPMINNLYHKKALIQYGYTAETFVHSVYFITSDFDYRADLNWLGKFKYLRFLNGIVLFLRAAARYRCVYIYFSGGPLTGYTLLDIFEPFLFKLSKTKVVVMPYGGDVHDMYHAKNLLFKHAMAVDYPLYYQINDKVKSRIRRWTLQSDFVISGCDWVDHTYHWDKLMLAHFSIDLNKFANARNKSTNLNREYTANNPLKVLHAPNHKTIKGSNYILQAVEDLAKEGFPIEITFLQKRSNEEILEQIAQSDIIADQLVIGWYAMFALEGLASKKPVICYLREDLIQLYLFAGLINSRDELPFLNVDFEGIKELFKNILSKSIDLNITSEKGLRFVEKYHSINAIGKVFDEVNKKILK